MHHSDFVHLHLHTKYSLLDGANTIDAIVDAADRYKMPALAITDHGNMYGAIDFYRTAVKKGIKPIIGCEGYIAPKSRLDKKDSYWITNASFHIILLASNLTGYKNLLKLVSSAHLDGFYYRPRIDKELLARHSEGLIVLSSCLKGEIPYRILQGRTDEAMKAAGEYIEIVGKDNFFFEIQDNGIEDQVKVNKELIALSKKLDVQVVATGDCHYLKKEDSKAHDILLCIQTGANINSPNRLRFSTDEFYMKSPDEMHRAFSEIPEALLNSKKIAERCNVELEFGKFYLPEYNVPDGYSREDYLEQLVNKGMSERIKQKDCADVPKDTYETRLKEELKVINSMGYSGYFLIVWDFINFAKANSIPVVPGRGSAAGSLVAYCLRITDINPLTHGLLFERFLNPERISMPDIDIDFCMDGRDKVIQYVTDKYGSDHVAQIITFGTMAARAAIRDVGRSLDIPYAEVDKVAKLVPEGPNVTIEDALKSEPKLKELINTDIRIKELIVYATALEGLTRHASTHAAGIVISKEPLTEYVPLARGTNGEVVTQFSMEDIEKVGLVKFDFLGLKTLTVIDRSNKLINQSTGGTDKFDITSVSLDDKATYELLSSGNTTGIFQLESPGMRDILVKIKPDHFDDLVAILALYRPGPLGSGMVDDYIKRCRGLIPVKYETPELKDILKETQGVIVYQEQAMKIANVLAGFSLGEADLLRRAMGKKDPETMRKVKKRAIESLIKSGAFDTTGARRSQILAVLDTAISIGSASQREKNQVSIFETLEANGNDPTGELLPDIPEWDEHVLLKNEKDTIGFYITGHPLARFESKIRRFSSSSSKDLANTEDGKEVTICGIITEIRTTLTKKGDKMAYVRLEDMEGGVELIVFPELYRSSSALLTEDRPVLAAGTVNKTDAGFKLKTTRISDLTEIAERVTSQVDISLHSVGLTSDDLKGLKEILLAHNGRCPVYLHLISNQKEYVVAIDQDLSINPSYDFMKTIEKRFGKDTVSFNY